MVFIAASSGKSEKSPSSCYMIFPVIPTTLLRQRTFDCLLFDIPAVLNKDAKLDALLDLGSEIRRFLLFF
jgi:hypothetical protein